jgi:Glycosyl transferase family 2
MTSVAPRVHLYATCWNDAYQLGWFFRHYDPIVERYVIFDDGSTDGSVDLLRRHPKVDLRRFVRTHADSFVLSELDLFNHCWKESRGGYAERPADWTIVCSLDEHLVHENLPDYLASCATAGVTVIPALGFQMFTEDFPDADECLCDTRTLGVPDPYDCKLTLFSPTAVEEINYEEGGHIATPVGRVLAPQLDRLVLRHYQLLSVDRTLARFAELRTGLGPIDRKREWGAHYNQLRPELLNRWAEYRATAVNTSTEPWKGYKTPEWWSRFPRP